VAKVREPRQAGSVLEVAPPSMDGRREVGRARHRGCCGDTARARGPRGLALRRGRRALPLLAQPRSVITRLITNLRSPGNIEPIAFRIGLEVRNGDRARGIVELAAVLYERTEAVECATHNSG
jgi:hypothetical protein